MQARSVACVGNWMGTTIRATSEPVFLDQVSSLGWTLPKMGPAQIKYIRLHGLQTRWRSFPATAVHGWSNNIKTQHTNQVVKSCVALILLVTTTSKVHQSLGPSPMYIYICVCVFKACPEICSRLHSLQLQALPAIHVAKASMRSWFWT